ncbi:hypothetical protein [Klebsiella pneumoniae]|uniref:hypothetical protein n=1 Tax=Klebsiella pneumoniae TaxID=573 RepID=UPI0037BEECF9
MNAVINFEYLVSPTLSDDIYFDKVVDNLRILSELLSSGICSIYLERDIVSKMHSYDYFPSERIFQHKISQLREGTAFCSSDIVRTIHTIIKHSEELEEQHIVEWDKEPEVESDIVSISQCRMKELQEIYCSMAIDGFFNQSQLVPVYYHPLNPQLTQRISFKGVIKDVEPACVHVLPLEFYNCLDVISNIDSIFSEMDGYELYKKAETELEYKFAFYVGVIGLIKMSALTTTIDWDDFKIGDGFVKSLKENQSFQGQQYSSVVYNAIVNLLADTEVNEIKPFYTTATSGVQRVYGEFYAYRVHITKSGRALRLLFWKDDYEVILSNIGNKNELLIYEP